MIDISANELKTKGVLAIQTALEQQLEAIISVRGKDRFVVMDVAHYQYLRECELTAALTESNADIAAGRFVKESAEDHLARLESVEGKLQPLHSGSKLVEPLREDTHYWHRWCLETALRCRLPGAGYPETGREILRGDNLVAELLDNPVPRSGY